MKYTLFLTGDRAIQVMQSLGDKVTIIEQDEELYKLEIDLTSTLDLLDFFQAGYIAGCNAVKSLSVNAFRTYKEVQ